MIIDAERLFGAGVINLDAENRRKRCEAARQLEPELFLGHELIVQGRHWVTHRQPRDGAPQPVAGHHDDIRFVQPLDQSLPLLRQVFTVHFHLAFAATGVRISQAVVVARRFEADLAIETARQRVIPVLVGNDAAIRDVAEHPF